MKGANAALLLLIAALAGLLVFEGQPSNGDPVLPQAAIPPVPATPAAAAPEATAAAATETATTLARPLFNPSRRPAAGTNPAAAGLPRLSGVLVSDAGRWALFAGTGDGRGVSVPEGGSVAGFVVRSVKPGLVVVDGPGGAQTLRLGFGGNATATTTAPPPAARGPAGIPIADLLRNGTPPVPPTPGLPRLGVPPPGEPPPPPGPGEAPNLTELLGSPMRDIGVPGLPPPSAQTGSR